MSAVEVHAAWYIRRFGECKPEWFVFAFGTPLPKDPTRPITSFKTAWTKVREKAGVKGRWHDNRHTFCSRLAMRGENLKVIQQLAGHKTIQMSARYAHLGEKNLRTAVEGLCAGPSDTMA